MPDDLALRDAAFFLAGWLACALLFAVGCWLRARRPEPASHWPDTSGFLADYKPRESRRPHEWHQHLCATNSQPGAACNCSARHITRAARFTA